MRLVDSPAALDALIDSAPSLNEHSDEHTSVLITQDLFNSSHLSTTVLLSPQSLRPLLS